MGQGRGQHGHVDDELGQLAGAVVDRVRPNRSDRATRDDCYQVAYLAGLEARRAAQRMGSHTSTTILFKKMQTAIYRLLRQRCGKDLRESDLAVA